ncbi:MAG TPA: prepilin peptidase [Vicinamibacterales bacterium]
MLTALCAGLGSAALIDSARRKIPNPITLGITVVGVGLAATGASGITVGSSLLGLFLGLIFMLPGHVLGSTGAGDVKLFAAAGAVVGAEQIVPAFLMTAIAGGLLAVFIAWRRGRLLRTFRLTARLFGLPQETRAAIESPGEHNRFPYGPAIAVGCVLAVLT